MIVGTAGHVDHGKTTLVRALTGVDTDRSKEEKARGITIDLGFAYMPGLDGVVIGLVDVPGHERLVRTMVAGAAAIDFALLVIAGDDGVMPQTREHLDILGLLGVSRGIVVVTKCDRIDANRRNDVADDIALMLAATALDLTPTVMPIRFVSAVTGEGIDALRSEIGLAACDRGGTGRDRRRFRMAVDRSFNLAGIGTIATGTVLDGHVSVGDEITILPANKRARVRSLHAQQREATIGEAGQRCALALAGSGIGKDVVGRGSWLCAEPIPSQTTRLDADIRVLASNGKPWRDWLPVHLHCGASDVPARVVALADEAGANARRAMQLVLESPLPLRRGDRFVLRDTSGRQTIGGGTVLDPRAPLRKRRSAERHAWLDACRLADHAQALDALLALAPGLVDAAAFATDRGLAAEPMAALEREVGSQSIGTGEFRWLSASTNWSALVATIVAHLRAFHAEHPELPGIAGERLRAAITPMLARAPFAAVRDRLQAENIIASQGHWLRLPDHVAVLSADDQRLAGFALPRLAAERFRPPRVRDLATAAGVAEATMRRACKAAARAGDLIEVAHDHFYLRTTVAEMATIADDLTRTSATGSFSAADFRDKLDNGRKVAIQILEHFDQHGLTLRKGDLRRVVKDPRLVFGSDAMAA